jgi:hypothetical protein
MPLMEPLHLGAELEEASRGSGPVKDFRFFYYLVFKYRTV